MAGTVRGARWIPSIAIVGTGFGGIGLAIELKRAGFTDLTLFERGDDVGGVWRANTYPGAACDVPAHLYSFSFAPNHRWTSNYPPQDEIRRYLSDTCDTFGIRHRIRFGTPVHDAHFDPATRRWTLTVGDGERAEFDLVVAAVGQLSAPSVPALPGVAAFEGPSFHSAGWDHTVDLRGRRVGVVGTGASAIQFVPHIQPQVAHLTLFQRSAPYVIPKRIRPFGERRRRLYARVPALQAAGRARTYVSFESRALGFTVDPRLLRISAAANRTLLDRQVPDPRKRAQLTPTDPIGCKRVLLASDYYPAVAAANVEVVTDRIDRVEAGGIRTADGVAHPLDVIIYGTGFAATDFLHGLRVQAGDGPEIHDRWDKAGGAEAHLGVTVAGYPNLVVLYGPNTNLGHNSIVYMLESQFRHVLSLLRAMRAQGATTFEPRRERQDDYNAWLVRRVRRTVFAAECHSWYRTAAGKHTNNWPDFTFRYRQRVARAAPRDYLLAR